MTEWEAFLNTWDREFKTTMKVLKNFPSDRKDFKPHEKSRTAAHLAEGFAVEEKFLVQVLKGQLDFSSLGYEQPAAWEDILKINEETHRASLQETRAQRQASFDKAIQFPTKDGGMEERRRGDVCWMMLYDLIHHRGQFSVYLRMVGGKVPSIYGPSLDEPFVRPK